MMLGAFQNRRQKGKKARLSAAIIGNPFSGLPHIPSVFRTFILEIGSHQVPSFIFFTRGLNPRLFICGSNVSIESFENGLPIAAIAAIAKAIVRYRLLPAEKHRVDTNAKPVTTCKIPAVPIFGKRGIKRKLPIAAPIKSQKYSLRIC